MSENLDLVRSIYAAVGHGDFGSADWADAEIEYVRADGFEPASLIGRDGLVAAMRSLFEALEGFRIEAEDYRELDAERVLVLTTAKARGKLAGWIELELSTRARTWRPRSSSQATTAA